MAASMNFRPGGYEGDDDDDELDGFYFTDTPIVQQLEAVAKNNNAQTSEQNNKRVVGGFGKPQTKVPGPNKKYTRSSDKMSETESHPLDFGDFQLAVMRGQVDTVREYLEKGFPVDTVLRTGWTGLMYAASHANPSLVQMLIDHGANPNSHKDMYTVLMAACGPAGYKEVDVLQCVNILLDKGADVNNYDRYHTTALMCAARGGLSEIIRTLVTHGANVAKQDNRGWTALSWAVSKRHRAAVGTLLEVGADPKQRHADGISVIQMAEYEGLDQMVDLLQGKRDVKPEVSSATASEEGDSESLGTDDTEKSVYGELELFLCGLDLTHLIGLFRSQHVDFTTFLTMSEEDLIKMGINQIGVRRKILDGIHGVHNKEWENSSLVQVANKKTFSCAEVLANIANISKHTKYISATVGVMQAQLQKHPQIVEDLQDGTGPRQLHEHTVDSLKNIALLRQRLTNLKSHLEEKLKTGNYNPPDAIDIPSNTSSKRTLYWSSAVIAVSVIGLLLWKQDSIREIIVVPDG